MRHSLVALSSLLLVAAGCGHSRLPTLPASHGQLSKVMDQYLNPEQATEEFHANVYQPLPDDMPAVVVEPSEAPAVFAEAVQVLQGQPSTDEVRQALADLMAACDASFIEACDFLKEQRTRPKKLEGPSLTVPREAFAKKPKAITVVQCRLGVDGVPRDCQALETAPYGITEEVLRGIPQMKYSPVMLAGHPYETPYTFQINVDFTGNSFTTDQELSWARARASRFPGSALAWAHLAKLLAKVAPEDPWYPKALLAITLLSPRYWWAANELAWLHAQEGRYPEAEPLAKAARRGEPRNPYVLETSAAVMLGLGRCKEAVLDQRRAVALLPAEWPAPERERFQRALEETLRKCPAEATAPVSAPPG